MSRKTKTNTTFRIEKNVPRPAGVPRPSVQPAYPFDDMKIGDSFLIPSPKDKTPLHIVRARVCSAMAVFQRSKHSDWRFSTRVFLEQGVRVWRIQNLSSDSATEKWGTAKTKKKRS